MVNRARRLGAMVVVGVVLALCAGCGAGPTGAPAVVTEPSPPVPKDAAQIARDVTQARIGTTIRVDRVRAHPAGERIVRFGEVDEVFEGTGVDLLRDASLAYVASTGITREDKAVVVVQHTLADDVLEGAIETIMQRSEPPGEWLTGTQVRSARVKVRDHERVLVLPSKDLLVVLPTALASQVDAFAPPVVLTPFEGPEAIVAQIDQPSESLRAKRAPPVPPTISRAEVRVVLPADGSIEIAADGQSTSPEQAAADAAALTRDVDKATTAKVAFVRVRFMDKITFRAEGDHVKADVKKSSQEVSKLLSMAEMFANRGR